MATLAVFHSVKDYDAWKPVFDEHKTVRDQYGCSAARVLRSAGAPNDVLVIMDYPTADAARKFTEDPSLAEAMGKAGVVSEPRIELYEGA